MDDISVEYIKDLVVKKKKTHYQVSLMLQEAFPGKRGLSERSIRRLCCENDIHSQQRLSQDDLEQCARTVVAKVGDQCIIDHRALDQEKGEKVTQRGNGVKFARILFAQLIIRVKNELKTSCTVY